MQQYNMPFACYNCGEVMENRKVDQDYMCGGHVLTLRDIEASVCNNCGGRMYSFEMTTLIQFVGHVLSLYDAPAPKESGSTSCNCGGGDSGHIEAVLGKLSVVESKLDIIQEIAEEAVISGGMRLYSEWMHKHGNASAPADRLTDSRTGKVLPGVTLEAVEEKLCRYEDSGVTPVRTMEFAHLYGKLEVSAGEVERLNDMCRDVLRAGLDPKKLCKWVQAELEGRLDILP